MRDGTRQCPLWVKSRHQRMSVRCPLYPRKRTSAQAALNGDADRRRYSRVEGESDQGEAPCAHDVTRQGNRLSTRGQSRGQVERLKFSADITGGYALISRKERPLNGIERSLSFRIIRPEIPGPIP